MNNVGYVQPYKKNTTRSRSTAIELVQMINRIGATANTIDKAITEGNVTKESLMMSESVPKAMESFPRAVVNTTSKGMIPKRLDSTASQNANVLKDFTDTAGVYNAVF